MNILQFKSHPPLSPFSPVYIWTMAETQLTDIDTSAIEKLVLSRESEMLEKYPLCSPLRKKQHSVDGYTNLGENSLTSRYDSYNAFDWPEPEIQKLKNSIHSNYLDFLTRMEVERSEVYIQAWFNCMRAGEQIQMHTHSTGSTCYLGGHVTIACEETATIYRNPNSSWNRPEDYYSKNIPGQLTFFQSNIPHMTTVHRGSNPRITLAFDIIIAESYKQRKYKYNCRLFDTAS